MEEKRSSTGMTVLITVLVMLVLGLGGFIIYDKVLNKKDEPQIKEDNKVEDKNNNTTVEEEPKIKNLSNDEKVKYNKELDKVWFSLYRLLPSSLEDLKSGDTLISTKQNKVEFLLELISRDDSIDKKTDTRGTGSLDVKLSDFTAKYKEVFNEDITESDISKKYTIKNGTVYGTYYTGFEKSFALKAEKVTKLDNGNYQLETTFATLDSDVEAFAECSDASKATCPTSVKSGKLLFEYGKKDNTNYLVSITFEK